MLFPYVGAPRLLGNWLAEVSAQNRFEQMMHYVKQGGPLLEYAKQTSAPYQPKLIWIKREDVLLTALGLQEAYADSKGQVTVICRDCGASKVERYVSQAVGLEAAELLLLGAFDVQIQMRNRASKGILNPYSREEPPYYALLAEHRYVTLEAHRPGPYSYESMAARVLLPR